MTHSISDARSLLPAYDNIDALGRAEAGCRTRGTSLTALRREVLDLLYRLQNRCHSEWRWQRRKLQMIVRATSGCSGHEARICRKKICRSRHLKAERQVSGG